MRGHSLLELLLVLAMLGVLLGIALPRLGAWRDRGAVHEARREIVSALAAARAAALARGTTASVVLNDADATVRVLADTETVLVHAVGAELGVTVRATRDSIAYAPSGRGAGAANTTIIVARGAAADTVSVSRLGRVRW